MLDTEAMKECQKRWDAIAHPLHSLGKMEDSLIKIAGMTGSAELNLKKRALVILCADNGVVEEGVTQTGQEVTAVVAENFLRGEATAAIFCRQTGTDIYPIDIGMVKDTQVPRRKVSYGTRNMAVEPAMTREQAEQAIDIGINLVREYKEAGYAMLATGEMGIGNTTTSSAVAAVLLSEPVEAVTGRGAGLSSQGLTKKIQVIQQAITRHKPDRKDSVDVLAKVGGLDLAGLAGIFLGGERYHMPVLVDGFISATAALAAARISPDCRDYMLASHMSKEPASRMILEDLGLEAGLNMDMCLGEGTGAVAMFSLLDLACAAYRGMSTFDDNHLEQYEELS